MSMPAAPDQQEGNCVSLTSALKTMDKSKLYAVGIAAFVLGGTASSYLGAPLGRGDALVREQIQHLNQRLTNFAREP